MKKITLSVLATIAMLTSGFSQATYVNLPIPVNDGGTSAFRGPNGTAAYAYERTVMFIHEWEMLPMNSASITSIKFQYSAGTGLPLAAAGQFTLWLENTTDTQNNKPNSFSTSISTMLQAYVGNFQVPQNAGQVALTLTTPFNYNGGGLYMAWDYQQPAGPYATNAATLTSNTTTGFLYYNNSGTAAVNTFTGGALFRPALLFSATNTATNEIEVARIQTPGKVSKLESATQTVVATIVNSSIGAQNNVSVTLNCTGANAFSTQSVIASMAAGAITNFSFTNYPTPNNGLSNVTAAVVFNDQNPSNNAKLITQKVSCNDVALAQPTVAVADYLTLTIGNGVVTSFLHKTGTSASSLTSVSCIIPSFANAANLGAQVYPVVANIAGVIVATGNTLTLAAGNLDVLQPLTFANAVNLTPNTPYLFGVGTTGTGYFPVGTISSYTIPGYYQFNIGGGTPVNANYGHLSLQAAIVFPGSAVTTAASSTLGCKNPAPGTVTLVASGSSGYTWSSGGTNAIELVTPTITTTYTVGGTDPVSACTGSSSITFSVINVAITATASKTLICKGQSSILTGAGATTYTWSSGTATTPTLSVAPIITTTYVVQGIGPVLGCKSNTVALVVTVNTCFGIAENGANSSNIYMYPNPALNGRTEIGGLTGVNTVTIYNLLGQVVLTQKTEKENLVLDLSNQPNGTYLVKISDSNDISQTVKIIVQN